MSGSDKPIARRNPLQEHGKQDDDETDGEDLELLEEEQSFWNCRALEADEGLGSDGEDLADAAFDAETHRDQAKRAKRRGSSEGVIL